MSNWNAALTLAFGFFVFHAGNEQLLVSTRNTLALLDLRLASLGLLPARLALGAFESAHKPLDLTGGIDDALLTGVERMALVAQIDAEIRLGRPCLPGVAARTGD